MTVRSGLTISQQRRTRTTLYTHMQMLCLLPKVVVIGIAYELREVVMPPSPTSVHDLLDKRPALDVAIGCAASHISRLSGRKASVLARFRSESKRATTTDNNNQRKHFEGPVRPSQSGP